MVVMITGIDLSQEIFAVNMFRTLKSSLKHRRKHVLRSLQLYGDQALVVLDFNSCLRASRSTDVSCYFRKYGDRQ